jgi:hypothetical protein
MPSVAPSGLRMGSPQSSARTLRACPARYSYHPSTGSSQLPTHAPRALVAGEPAGPDRRLVGSTWATLKLPWLRIATRLPSAIRPVGVVVNSRQGVGARLEGNGIASPLALAALIAAPRHAASPAAQGGDGREWGPLEKPGWNRGVDRVQRGCLYVRIC